MDSLIRKLSPSDVSIAQELFLWFQVDDGDINLTTASDDYLRNLLSQDSFHVLVALDNEQIIGGLTAYELPMYKEEVLEMFLYEIGVKEEYRQQGIAKQLIEALKKICAEKGIRIIFVGTSTDNEPARRLYKATGGEMEEIPWFTYHLDN